MYLLPCPLPDLGPSTRPGILTAVRETHPETGSGGRARRRVKTWAAGVSFLQQEWFLARVHGSHSGHSDPTALGDGDSRGPPGRRHLSAVVIRGVGKHVLQSVRLGEEQPDLFVAPVYRRQVL